MKTVTEFSYTLGMLVGIVHRDDQVILNRYGWDIVTRLTNLAADIYAKNIEIEKLENEMWEEMEATESPPSPNAQP